MSALHGLTGTGAHRDAGLEAGVVRLHYAPHSARDAKIAPLVDGLHPQEAFHQDRYRITFRAAFAGTGAGKTAAGAFELISWMLENAECVCLAGEPDFPMALRVMIPALAEVLGVPGDDLGASPIVKSWNRTTFRLELVNGSVCWIISLDDPAKMEGPNVDFVWLDEIRLLRKWADTVKQVKRRLRGSKPGLGRPVGAVFTTHSPTKEQSEEFERPSAASEGKRCYRWTTYDNPLLSRAYLQELEASHGGAAARAVIYGEFAQPEGRVLSHFKTPEHITRRPDPPIPERLATHPPRPGDPPAAVWATRVSYGVDWGFGEPSCIIAVAWAGAKAVIIDESYGGGRTLDDLKSAARDMVAKWGAGTFYCGHDEPEHIKEFRELGLDAVSIQSVKGAFGVFDGLAIMDNLFRIGELRIAEECKHWLWEEERYAWKPGKEGQAIEKSPDHAIDASRYAIMGERARPRLSFATVSRR